MTPCVWQQFLQREQPAKARYELLDGILMSRVGLVGDGDHAFFVRALRKLISEI